jgi:hypothetical protein
LLTTWKFTSILVKDRDNRKAAALAGRWKRFGL